MLGQNGSSRLDTVLKMLLIAFVSLLAFSSGVYFGKEMSDSEYQLKSLEKDFNDGEQHADNSHDAEGKKDIGQDDTLIDQEVAALSEKYINGEGEEKDEHGQAREVASVDEHAAPPAAHHEEPSHKEEPAHHAPAHGKAPAAVEPKGHHAPAKTHGSEKAHAPAKVSNYKSDEMAPIRKGNEVADRVANNEAPTVPVKVTKPENRKPASLPQIAAGVASAEYTVQVASYPTERDAQAHAAELVKKGFPAYPLEATIKGKTWYRVSVGSFKSQKDASEYRAQLVKQARVSSAIVQKIDR